jgi:molybdate transport system substrate-binding protein
MASIRILTSNSTRQVLDVLIEAYTATSGNEVSLSFDTAKSMVAKIRAGEQGDVVILGRGALDDLADAGIVVSASRLGFARAVVGVGVRSEAPWPDISSVDAFRDALLASKSIAHTRFGASGMYIPAMLEKLGIAEQMKARTVNRDGGYIGEVVVAGEADIALQQIPELLAVPGLDVVGPVPDAVQKTFTTAAGICRASTQVETAQAMLDFFTDASHAALFADKGLQQVNNA